MLLFRTFLSVLSVFFLLDPILAFPFTLLSDSDSVFLGRSPYANADSLCLDITCLVERITSRSAPGLVRRAVKSSSSNSPSTSSHQVPSVSDIEKQLHFAPNTALFWSGDREAAASYAKSHGLKTMDMAISGPTPWNTPSMQDPKFKDEYWDRASTAMVNVVSGTVYAMLRGGLNDPITHPGTVWTRKEWPDLKAGKNKKITKIVRINPQGQTVGQIWPNVVPLRGGSHLKM